MADDFITDDALSTKKSTNAVRIYGYDATDWRRLFADPGGFLVAQDFETALARGKLSGFTPFSALGRRTNIQVVVSAEDLWEGSAAKIPIPADAGEQLEIISTSDEDGGSAGDTGGLSVLISYLDNTGAEQTVTESTNGDTLVVVSVSNIRYVQDFRIISVGSAGVAVGDIKLYKQGSAATVYSIIKAGGNVAMTGTKMVPVSKQAFISSWCSSLVVTAKDGSLRLRATAFDNVLYPGVFHFQSSIEFKEGTQFLPLKPPIGPFPPFTIIKVSAWMTQNGANASICWNGWIEPA